MDYAVEWVTWHLSQGFSHFFLADNGSRDGTCEFLESLEQLGICNLLRVPAHVKGQASVYNRLLSQWGNQAQVWCFIDADEFVCPNSAEEGVAADILTKFFNDQQVGAVAINWRCFGSGGALVRERGDLIERFTAATSDQRFLNHHIKSVVRPAFVGRMHVHHAELVSSRRYLNSDGVDAEFLSGPKNRFPVKKPTEFSEKISEKIRINHYLLKSRDEFLEKKAKRGWLNGVDAVQAEKYFSAYDFNDEQVLVSSCFVEAYHRTKEYVFQRLRRETIFFEDMMGHVELLNKNAIAGWCAIKRDQGLGRDIRIKVIVNERDVYFGAVYRFRPDLLKSKASATGMAGFFIGFPVALKPGDSVRVGVVGNVFDFGGYVGEVSG